MQGIKIRDGQEASQQESKSQSVFLEEKTRGRGGCSAGQGGRSGPE